MKPRHGCAQGASLGRTPEKFRVVSRTVNGLVHLKHK